MKRFLKKHYKRIIVLLLDAMIVPGALVCKLLTEHMLETEATCAWTVFGGKCLTCGGTHFVRDLSAFILGGDITSGFEKHYLLDAFLDNQLLFVMTLFFFVTLVMFNLWFVFGLDLGKKGLKIMYSVPSAIIFGVVVIGFLVWRNWMVVPNATVYFMKLAQQRMLERM